MVGLGKVGGNLVTAGGAAFFCSDLDIGTSSDTSGLAAGSVDYDTSSSSNQLLSLESPWFEGANSARSDRTSCTSSLAFQKKDCVS